MAISPDNRYAYFDHETSRALDFVYRYHDPSCDHSAQIFARLETSDHRWHIYQCCVICGKYSSSPLPYAQHPDYMSYPIIVEEFGRFFTPARHIRTRYRSQDIFAVGDSGGYLVCKNDLFHICDSEAGRSTIYRWNECVDAIAHHHITPGRRKLLQFSLYGLSVIGGDLTAEMATSIDLSEYENPLLEAFNEIGVSINTVSLRLLDENHDPELTKFDDNPKYSDYLASKQWRNNRDAAIAYEPNIISAERGRPSCENPYCRSFASKVDCHHLTYRNVGHEQPGELIFLCRECHGIAEFFKAHTEYASRSIA